MVDTLKPAQRSDLMRRIRSTRTKPERIVATFLTRHGFELERNVRVLPGSPDFVLPQLNVVIFVHGCFWHRHACRAGQSKPSTRRRFWMAKFAENIRRDRRTATQLRRCGWHVFTIWECQIRPTRLDNTMQRLWRRLTAAPRTYQT
jgi:DNA mismatch endonuclease (patch repair protein)